MAQPKAQAERKPHCTQNILRSRSWGPWGFWKNQWKSPLCGWVTVKKGSLEKLPVATGMEAKKFKSKLGKVGGWREEE